MLMARQQPEMMFRTLAFHRRQSLPGLHMSQRFATCLSLAAKEHDKSLDPRLRSEYIFCSFDQNIKE